MFAYVRLHTTLAVCLLCGIVATSAAEAADATYPFNIPEESVADTLRAIGHQTAINIVFAPETVDDSQSPAIHGDLTIEQAVMRAISKTKLQARQATANSILIERLVTTSSASVSNQPKFIRIKDDGAGTADPPGPRSGQSYTAARAVQDSPQYSANSTSLAEIVVTAQKREENVLSVPVPVTAISAQALINYNEFRVQDYATSIPGLSYVSSGSQAEDPIAIRGITSGLGTNPTVGITVDGVPYGSPLNKGNGNEVPDIDPNDLERVEVLRGPQGTLYGASSMGGLLNFVTKEPSFDAFSGNVSGGTSSVYNGVGAGYNFRASANIPLSDSFAMRVSAFTRQDPGYVDNIFIPANGINEDHASGGRIALKWALSDSVALNVSALYQDLKADGSADVNSGPGYAGSIGDLQQNYYPGIDGFRGLGGYDRKTEAYNATLTAKFAGVDLTSVTAYNINSNRDTWDFTDIFGPVTKYFFNGVEGTPVDDNVAADNFTQELRLTGTVLERIDWLIGGFYEDAHTKYLENIYAEDPTGAITGTWANWSLPSAYREYAGFADLTYHFTDQFDVQLGGRESHVEVINPGDIQLGLFSQVANLRVYTPENSSTASVFTYLLTPRYKFTPDMMLYARLASGYRPGGPNGPFTPAGLPQEINPDKTYDYEIGFKADFLDHRLSLDGSIYYIDWRDLQASLTSATGLPYGGNAGGAKSEGVELSIAARPLTGLTLSGWIDYDDAVITEGFPPGSGGFGLPGDRLPYSSEWSGHTSVQQDFPLWANLSGFIGGQVAVVGDRLGAFGATPSSSRQYYPGYAEVDLRGGIMHGPWTLNLYANNLADRRVVAGGGSGTYPPTGFQYITPRTIGLNVSTSF